MIQPLNPQALLSGNKEGKKDAVAEVKRLILRQNPTKGDIRGKAMKRSEG